MPRLYEPIWKEIKGSNKKVTITVPRVFSARIKKAVIKEKWMDEGYKLLNDSDKWKLVIEYDGVKELMSFYLKPAIGIDDRVLEEVRLEIDHGQGDTSR